METIIELLNSVITTLVEYFRMFDVNQFGEVVKMITDNLNFDTIKTTFSELGNFFSDLFAMIKQ